MIKIEMLMPGRDPIVVTNNSVVRIYSYFTQENLTEPVRISITTEGLKTTEYSSVAAAQKVLLSLVEVELNKLFVLSKIQEDNDFVCHEVVSTLVGLRREMEDNPTQFRREAGYSLRMVSSDGQLISNGWQDVISLVNSAHVLFMAINYPELKDKQPSPEPQNNILPIDVDDVIQKIDALLVGSSCETEVKKLVSVLEYLIKK